MTATTSKPARRALAPRPRGLVAGLAVLVLAMATGTPLRSAHALIPDADAPEAPYLGV